MLAPVVFTSALDLGELFADSVVETFGEPVWIISQGPQVLLDAQVTEVRGGLLLNWDVREGAFPRGLIDAMFAGFTEAVESLSRGDAGWDDESTVTTLPSAQARVRAAVNATDGPVSGRACIRVSSSMPRRTPGARRGVGPRRRRKRMELWGTREEFARRSGCPAGVRCATG